MIRRGQLIGIVLLILVLIVGKGCSVTQFTLTIQSLGEGTVDPIVGQHPYDQNALVYLTATPTAGWEFSHWDGEVTEKYSASTTILMDRSKAIRAVFFSDFAGMVSLEPGTVSEGVDGLLLGAIEGAQISQLELWIVRVDESTIDVPFPEFLTGEQVVSNFYNISSIDQDYVVEREEELLFGIPLSEGVLPDNLAFLVLVPPSMIIQDFLDDDSSLRWLNLQGVFDESTGVFGTQLPSVYREPNVFALVENIGYSSNVVETQFVSLGGFHITCVGFNPGQCTDADKILIGEALDQAYQAYTDMGLVEPALRRHLVKIDFSWPPKVTLGGYAYELRKGAPNGGYSPGTKTAWTTYLGVPATPEIVTTRHELFHAIQFGYNSILNTWNSKELTWGAIEGLAVAAEESLIHLTRGTRFIREPLLLEYPLFNTQVRKHCVSWLDYSAQDFWVFVGKRIEPFDPKLSLLIPILESGATKEGIDNALQQTPIFESLADAYWQWAKDYALEKQTLLGFWGSEPIPKGHPGQWWAEALGTKAHNTIYVDSTPTEDSVAFSLQPLSSRVMAFVFEPDLNEPYQVTIKSRDSDSKIMFKVYDGTEQIHRWSDQETAIFSVWEKTEKIYVLVSNVCLDSLATVSINYNCSPLPPPKTEKHNINGVNFQMSLAPAATFPTNTDDSGTAIVDNDFWIAETHVTYELWYTVRQWALSNGYIFCPIYAGREGNQGNPGEAPTSKKNEPVTEISWRDSIVWCNALSELAGYEPLYIYQGNAIRDATNVIACDNAVQGDSSGFRLLTSNEWELAARYRGGLFWTPGDYASGAKGPWYIIEMTQEVAWYRENSGNSTKDVGLKHANALGLYDMSGNVFDWCFDLCAFWGEGRRVARGGCWESDAIGLQIGLFHSYGPGHVDWKMGLRLARTDYFIDLIMER